MSFIDTHSHYQDKAFDGDRYELLERIHRENGVRSVIVIGYDIPSSETAVEMAERLDFVFAAVGVHPEECNDIPENWLDEVRRLAAHEKVCAIGEIGLDYHYEGYDKKRQEIVFRRQLELAKELKKPVSVHVRDASEDSLRILSDYGQTDGVMHCFAGSAETAEQVLKLGMHISFTGVLTFKNAKKALKALERVPLDRLLTETDCPYMAPEPFRGQRCDSSMIIKMLEKIAEVKGISVEDAAKATSENAVRLFGLA
ncbi:MAG: TatD family hydrolase [Oscillospiraceae bacterium]|nr:TatD family hydrolase [Oscillospiraceae bacterium]